MHCEIIADPSDHRHNTVASNLQRMSLFERGGGYMGWSIGHRSGGAMSCAQALGLYAGEMYQPGRIYISFD